MSKNNLFKSMFALLFAFAAVAFVGCKEDIEDVQAPELTVAPAVLNFDELGGSETVQLTANCDWSIAETPSWVDIQPMSGSGNTTLTVTTYPKNENQKLVVYFTLYHPEYGMWGKSKNTLTINQTYGGEPIVEDVFYSNDFDKEAATKTYGSGESWPYLDQFDGWQNQTGTGVENVSYSYKSMSARNNSNSDGSYSDYAGSGVNNMFFGSGAYLQIENIAITSTNVNLTFGGEKYLNGSDNLFKPEEFLITLSADGENWSAPISYTQPEGAGRWNVGSADFTLPEGTTTLWIKFEATVASAYRIDDVKLMGGLGGQQITFDGGSVTPPGPGPQPTDAIYSNDFDKAAADKTYGSGSSWPYLDQFDGWQNETGSGAANVTYDYKGASARNNSNSDGSYSDYAGSGVNNIFFGTNAYLTIGNIALETNKLNLTFGGEKYLQGSDNTFSTSEFTITLSADGQNWSAPIEYTAPAGQGRWNVGSADFTLPEGTKTLYIKFEASVASAYRIDDVKLVAGNGGQEVNLEGGETPGPGPQPTDAIYSNDFDKAAADKTYGSGSSWPYLDQFDGWQNETGSGAANVTYDYKGASARNNSNSDGSYSDYAGSGVNNIFFGTNAYLTIGNIALETNKLNLTFGGEKYLQGSDNTFSTSEFTITLSADGTNWSAPIEYTAPAGQGRWNVGSADFTLPEGTTTLYIKFEALVASAYRIDDVKLVAGNGGQEVNIGGGEEPSLPEWGIYGTFTGWGKQDDIPLYPNAATSMFVAKGVTIAADDLFEVRPYNSSRDVFGGKTTDPVAVNGSIELVSPIDGNAHNISVAAAGTYDIYFDHANMTLWVMTQGLKPGEGGEEPTPGDGVKTIAEVLALGKNATIQSAVIEATVISNMDLNNLTSKKGLYVQDATAGLQFYLAANHELKFGDKVKIDLSGAQIGEYNGAIQISGLALEKITTLSSGNAVEAKTVTMADFLANKYEGQYVAIEGVQVASADLAKTWVMDGSHTSIAIEDANGNSFAIFSSKYATYGAQTVAQGSGTIKGISSISKGAMQLIFAQQSDYAGLTGARFDGGTVTPDPTPTPGDIEKITIAEFLNKPVDASVYYELTGEIVSIAKADYGNITIADETSSVYIYGLTATKQSTNDKSFSSLGLKVGDVVTLHTVRGEYNGEAQGGGSTTPAYYISHQTNTTTPDEGGFTKVTSVAELTDGEYLIVYDANSPAYVFNGADMVNGYEEATVQNNTISGAFTGVVEIVAMAGGYSIKAPAGYLSGTADANKLNFGSVAAENTITFEADGTALITSNTSVLRFNSASNQLRFRYYKAASYTGQQPVSLYKKN